jgi:hypothetical protein
MSGERCAVTELLVGECAGECCRPTPRPPAFVAPAGPAPTITAAYGGWCPNCGDRIEVGDRLVKVDGAWSHQEDYE